MKRHLICTCAGCLLLLTCVPLIAQVNLTRTLIASLQAGEQPMTSECCFSLSANQNTIYLVTTLNGQYYAYENGKRLGPYAKHDESFLQPCSEDISSGCSYYRYEVDMSKYGDRISNEMDEGQYFTFRGKQFGPLMMINNVYEAPDKSWFIMTGATEEFRYQMITADGSMHDLGNRMLGLHVSPSGKSAFVSSVEEATMGGLELFEMDFSNMTLEEIMAFTQKYTENQENAPPPEGFIVMHNGTRLGPFNPVQMHENNPSYCQTGGDHWFMILDNQLYVDGIKVKDFGDAYVNPCDLWLSEDGKRYAIAAYDKITFSDGNAYPNPLKVVWYRKGGQIYLSWVSFENRKDIVLYSRPL